MSDEQARPAAEPVEQHDDAAPSVRRPWLPWVIGAAIAAVVIVGIVLALTPRPAGSAASPTGSESPAGSSSTPSPAGSSSTPSPADTAAPSESAAAAPSASTPAAGTDAFPELAPVAPRQTGSAEGLEAVLTQFESVQGEVVGPGDVAAAAVRVTVAITNTGSAPLDLNLVVMNAYMGAQRDPAETYEQPGGQPVSGSLEPGDTAEGVYLFRIPEDRRDDVTIVLDYRAGQPAIVFRGEIP